MQKVTLRYFLESNYISQYNQFAVSKLGMEVERLESEWYSFLKDKIDLSNLKEKYDLKKQIVVEPALVNSTPIEVPKEVQVGVSEIVDNIKKNK